MGGSGGRTPEGRKNFKKFVEISNVKFKNLDQVWKFWWIFLGGGGTPRPLKGYHAPPAGGPGGKGPPDGSEVSFFKTIQSIWKSIQF